MPTRTSPMPIDCALLSRHRAEANKRAHLQDVAARDGALPDERARVHALAGPGGRGSAALCLD